MTDDEALERDLRAMLAARDPGPAPTVLATVVRSRLHSDRGPRRLVAIGRWAGTAAVLGAVAAILILAVVAARPISISPGSTPLPTPAQPYSIQPGDGVVAEDHVPVGQAVAGLLAFAALFVAVRISTDRRARIGAVLGIALIGLVALSIGTSDAIGFDGGSSGADPSGPGSSNPPGTYVAVTGDRPFTVTLTVTNTSRLPLTIEGIPEQGTFTVNGRTQPRLVGLGLLPVCCDPAAMQPFEPTTVQPGGSVDLAIGGMAGDCAIPADATGASRFASFDQVPIVYEQLTIWHTANIRMPEAVVVPASGADCP